MNADLLLLVKLSITIEKDRFFQIELTEKVAKYDIPALISSNASCRFLGPDALPSELAQPHVTIARHNSTETQSFCEQPKLSFGSIHFISV
jgi:hypothetical protein